MLFLLWFQIFLTFAAGEELRVDVLTPGGMSVIKALERTGSELVVPAIAGVVRSRVKISLLLLLTAASLAVFFLSNITTAAKKSRHAFDAWSSAVGVELNALPHSDMVRLN